MSTGLRQPCRHRDRREQRHWSRHRKNGFAADGAQDHRQLSEQTPLRPMKSWQPSSRQAERPLQSKPTSAIRLKSPLSSTPPRKAFGPVTLLVNNAASRGDNIPANEVDAADFDAIFQTNVRGPILCMTEFARPSRGQRRAHR